MITGYFNAKIGHDTKMSRFVGNESLHKKTSMNGNRLLNFAISKNMVIGSPPYTDKSKTVK